MKKQFFAYSKTRKNGKYMEITEETYHEMRATGEHYFICLDGAFLECEEQEYRAYFKEKDHADYIQKDKNFHKVDTLSYEELLQNGYLEKAALRDMTTPTMEQYIEEHLIEEWEQAALHKALSTLTAQEHDIIYQIFWLGNSETQLAHAYGVRQQTMHKKVKRILDKLLKFMTEEK